MTARRARLIHLDPFDPRHLAANDDFVVANAQARRSKSERGTPDGGYIRIPLAWHRLAVAACGSAQQLACAELLYRAAVIQRTTTPTMPTEALKEYGIDRQVRRRTLDALEAAGLVAVERRANRNPRVTIRCGWFLGRRI